MNKYLFNRYLSELIDVSFVFNSDWGKWERQERNRIEQIFIGYNEYPDGSYYPKGMSAAIKFIEVENILNQILDKYNIQQRYENDTVHTVLFNINGVDYSRFKTEIHDEVSFYVVAEEIKKIVEYGAMPFFEKYQTLEDVANLLSDKKPEEVVPYIQGAILFPKAILILKLTNHPQFEKKIIEFREVLEQQANKKDIYKQMLIVYDDLFSEDLKGLRYV